MARGTELGRQAKAVVDRGELVSDTLVNQMVASRLAEGDCRRGFILDGFPRTPAQAEWLDRHFSEQIGAISAPLVISVVVPYNLLFQRLTGRRTCPICGKIYNIYFEPPVAPAYLRYRRRALVTRKDDAESVIAERLEELRAQTAQLAEHYRKSGHFVEINGDQPIDVGHERDPGDDRADAFLTWRSSANLSKNWKRCAAAAASSARCSRR